MRRAVVAVLAASVMLLASPAAATPIKVSFVSTKSAAPAPAPHALKVTHGGAPVSFATTKHAAPAPAPAAKHIVHAASAAPAPAKTKAVAAARAPAPALAARSVALPALPAVGSLPALPALSLQAQQQPAGGTGAKSGRKLLQADPDDDQTTLTDVLLLPEPAKPPAAAVARAPAPAPPSRSELRRERNAGIARAVGSALVNAVAPVDASAPSPPPVAVPEVTEEQRARVRGPGVTDAPAVIVPGATVPRGVDTPGDEGFVLPGDVSQAGADAEARVAAGGSAAAPAPAPPKRTVKLPALPASSGLGLPALPPVAVGVDPANIPKLPARRAGAPEDGDAVDDVDAGAADAAVVAP